MDARHDHRPLRATAEDWRADRGDELTSNDCIALGLLTEGLPAGATILDVGCGNGRPQAAELLRLGFRVTGVDSSPSLLDQARSLAGGEWIVGDMRTLDLGRRFDAVTAWFSLFHLSPEDQRVAIPALVRHVRPGGRLTFASGPEAGVLVGDWRGDPLYHASLSPDEYREILLANGCSVERQVTREPGGDGPTAWSARRMAADESEPITEPARDGRDGKAAR